MTVKSSEKKVAGETVKKPVTEAVTPKKDVQEAADKKEKKKNAKVKIKKATKIKNLCKWKKKQIADKFDEFSALVIPAGYICRKCGRVAAEAGYLCKPKKIEK